MKDAEQIIRKIDGSMTIEGMILNQDNKERIRKCLTKKSFEGIKREVIEKHAIRV